MVAATVTATDTATVTVKATEKITNNTLHSCRPSRPSSNSYAAAVAASFELIVVTAEQLTENTRFLQYLLLLHMILMSEKMTSQTIADEFIYVLFETT
jgi:hypothetical protein